MLVINTQQETSLLAVLEGKHTPADLTSVQGVFRQLVSRRTFRLGIEQAQEVAARLGPGVQRPGSQDRA